jgi:hypothetical protein
MSQFVILLLCCSRLLLAPAQWTKQPFSLIADLVHLVSEVASMFLRHETASVSFIVQLVTSDDSEQILHRPFNNGPPAAAYHDYHSRFAVHNGKPAAANADRHAHTGSNYRSLISYSIQRILNVTADGPHPLWRSVTGLRSAYCILSIVIYAKHLIWREGLHDFRYWRGKLLVELINLLI